MAEVDELISKVAGESGKSVEEVTSKMSERKERTHGLLSDYGAVYAVAKELGIALDGGKVSSPVTKISELAAGKPVNVLGRVKAVYSPREFSRKDGSKGRFASLLLVDESAETRLVLWDSNAELTKHVHVGDVLLARNGFCKDNRGAIEVHAGSLTNITVNPKDAGSELPQVEQKVNKVGELAAGNPAVNITLRVNNYFPRTEFSRSDGSTGSRASFIGEDESGKVRVVLWDAASEVELAIGDSVKIENGYTREGLNGEVELQAGGRSRVLASEEKLKLAPLQAGGTELKVSEIQESSSNVNLKARVMQVYAPREYSKGVMASLIVGDESGSIRVVLWDERASLAETVARGDAVSITNGYARSNLSEEPELHVGKYGSIEKAGGDAVPSLNDIEGKIVSEKNIDSLEPSGEHVRLSAKIVDLDTDRPLVYMTCPACGKRVQNLGGAWFCEACGDVDAQSNLVVSVVLEDDSGNIRAIAFKENAEKLIGSSTGTALTSVEETQSEATPLLEARDKLVGKSVSVVGTVKYNEFSDQLEFIVDDVLSA